MGKRKPSPTAEDIRRMVDAFNDKDKTGQLITSQDKFDRIYNNYFKANPIILKDQSIRLRVAEGVNDKRAERGLERWPISVRVTKEKRPKFRITGKIKGRTVFLRAETVKIKGKSYTRYRDAKGRFGKIKAGSVKKIEIS